MLNNENCMILIFILYIHAPLFHLWKKHRILPTWSSHGIYYMVNPCPGVHVFDLLHGNSFSSFTSHAPTSPMRRNASQHVLTKTYREYQKKIIFFSQKKNVWIFFFCYSLELFWWCHWIHIPDFNCLGTLCNFLRKTPRNK